MSMQSIKHLNITNYIIINTLGSEHIEWLKDPDNFIKFKELFIEECNNECIFYCIGLGNNFIDDLIEVDPKDSDTETYEKIEKYRSLFNKLRHLDINDDNFIMAGDFPIIFTEYTNPYVITKILDILDKILEKLMDWGLEHSGSLCPMALYEDNTLFCTASVNYP